jgi:hypothetical protein
MVLMNLKVDGIYLTIESLKIQRDIKPMFLCFAVLMNLARFRLTLFFKQTTRSKNCHIFLRNKKFIDCLQYKGWRYVTDA